MSITPLNIGSAPNDGNGQNLRSGGQVINANFAELDTRTAAAQSKADAAIPALQKGVANGVATLGADSKIPAGQLPALAISEVFTVASQAAMLALTAERGDGAIRTDQNGQWYILTTDVPTVLANWKPINQNLGVALTALGALTPAADTIAYFSGTATAATTAFTAKARSLLARTDTAGMQAEMALVPVSSVTDVTAGRLLTVKYGGLGVANNGTYLGVNLNPDTYLTGNVGLWGSFLINGVSTNGFLSVVSGESDNYYQRFVDRVGAVTYERTAAAGVWTAWTRVVKVGDFGLGSPGIGNPWITDVNTLNATRMFSYGVSTTANLPTGGDYGEGIVMYGAAAGEANALFMNHDTDRAFGKRKRTGVWQPSYEFHTTANSTLDPALGTGGLMSSAAVSGWVVEKFANGLAIATGQFATASLAANALTVVNVTVPSIFVDATGCSPTVCVVPRGSTDVNAANAFMQTLTNLQVYAKNGAIAQVWDLRIKVVGRWKA